MKPFGWSAAKNAKLKQERNIGFEDVLFHIEHDDLLDIVEHPNQEKYPGQMVYVLAIEGYVYLVPFIETEDKILLKTIIPSRKATKQYRDKL